LLGNFDSTAARDHLPHIRSEHPSVREVLLHCSISLQTNSKVNL
jgi:hypothetical protein